MANTFFCKIRGCKYLGASSKGNLNKHRWAAHGIRSTNSRTRKRHPAPTKAGKMPVEIHFCYNCGAPQPKEIGV